MKSLLDFEGGKLFTHIELFDDSLPPNSQTHHFVLSLGYVRKLFFSSCVVAHTFNSSIEEIETGESF